ncbi:MAG: DUF4388 domain-containing protein [Acidobacteria bacterium]|nr:DUF4388 domain-containing protein [Acidobacteriota bacterium]
MAISGNLKTVSLMNVLQLLEMERATGALVLSRDKDQVTIYLRQGSLIHATSSFPDHRIGAVLIKKKYVSQAEIVKALRFQKEERKKIGNALLESKVLRREQLHDALKFQIQEIIYDSLKWKDGNFSFEENRVPDPDVMLVSINLINLMMEGAQRLDEWQLIHEHMPPENAILGINFQELPKFPEIKLTAEEFPILFLVDGKRSIRQVCRDSTMAKFETYKTLHGLMAKGLIRNIGVEEIGEEENGQGRIPFELLAPFYRGCFVLVDETLQRKLGPAWKKVRRDPLVIIKLLYPELFADVDFAEDGTEAFEVTLTKVQSLPEEIQCHALLSAWNGLLLLKLETVRAILGAQVRHRLVDEILENVRQFTDKEKAATERFQLQRELQRCLRAPVESRFSLFGSRFLVLGSKSS